MKLEIESDEELAAAIAAIEDLRRTKVRHIGKFVNRLDLQCEQTTREGALARAWIETNRHNAGINGGFGALEWLLCSEGQSIVRELTPDEALTAATVIQWLGTNVGFCWLTESLKSAGYVISKSTAFSTSRTSAVQHGQNKGTPGGQS